MLAVAGKLIHGGRKSRMTGKSTILRLIDHLARMFNSCTDRKGLLNHSQKSIEHKAFDLGGRDYTAPCQLVGDFLNDTPSKKLSFVNPSFTTGVTPSDIRLVLPKKVTDTMASAIVRMDKKLSGFALPQAVLTAPESRS